MFSWPDLRRKEELSEAGVKERDTSLKYILSVSSITLGRLICRLGNTYAENHETADNGLVLGVGGLVVEGADKALLGPRAGGNDALVRGHCVYDVRYEGRGRSLMLMLE